MICYKDMTFCIARCKTEPCSRKLTPEVRAKAKVWWGSDDAPIAVSNFEDICGDFERETNV